MSEPASHPVPIRIQLTPNWAITLNEQFQKQDQGDSLHLFNARLSIWIRAMRTTGDDAIIDRMDRDAARAPDNATDATSGISAGVGRVTYIAPPELRDGKPVPPVFYSYAHGAQAQLMMAFYHKGPSSLKAAQDIFASLEYIDV